jgi:hypothetical protein
MWRMCSGRVCLNFYVTNRPNETVRYLNSSVMGEMCGMSLIAKTRVLGKWANSFSLARANSTPYNYS